MLRERRAAFRAGCLFVHAFRIASGDVTSAKENAWIDAMMAPTNEAIWVLVMGYLQMFGFLVDGGLSHRLEPQIGPWRR